MHSSNKSWLSGINDMNGVGFIGAIIIGIFAGWIAEQIMGRNHGLITNLIVGLVGALIGAFLASMLGIHFMGWIGSLIISTIGAIVLLFILGLFSGRRRI
jgi:uncharacterized membrane protein YeaQ/YmgE (transglycosylase-associated protein family)